MSEEVEPTTAEESTVSDVSEIESVDTQVEQVQEEQAADAQVVDWAGRIAEWGGEESVADAIALQNALRTREGVEALARQALNALGVGDDKFAELFGASDDSSTTIEPSIEDLLADPDRVLTAAEVAKLLDAREDKRRAELTAQQMAVEVVRHTDATLESLGVTDEADKTVLIALADKIIGDGPMDGPSIKNAITKAHAQFTERVKANAAAIVAAKHKAQTGLPTPLPASGASAGGDEVAEPRTVAEAIARTRKQFGL